MVDVTRDDLRAAVAAGHLTEAQAADVLALAQVRAGVRVAEDEPFELFRGFSEIFVAVGLSILITGAFGLTALLGNPGLITAIWAGIAWILARYFTLKRRMMLPSIVLVTAFAAAAFGTAGWFFARGLDDIASVRGGLLLSLAATAAALIAWYRQFRLPFTMFLIGATGFVATLVMLGDAGAGLRGLRGWQSLFDLRQGGSIALGTLIFGLLALAGGLWFDMRDPHRLGRNSASGFWLHLTAAPALVNTVALTFYRMGPGTGYALLALSLAAIALLALIIDRRSFLTAGIGYLIFLIGYVTHEPGDPRSWASVLLIVGLGLTALGTFWTDMRTRLMRALPDFPGKSRLPPYSE